MSVKYSLVTCSQLFSFWSLHFLKHVLLCSLHHKNILYMAKCDTMQDINEAQYIQQKVHEVQVVHAV